MNMIHKFTASNSTFKTPNSLVRAEGFTMEDMPKAVANEEVKTRTVTKKAATAAKE